MTLCNAGRHGAFYWGVGLCSYFKGESAPSVRERIVGTIADVDSVPTVDRGAVTVVLIFCGTSHTFDNVALGEAQAPPLACSKDVEGAVIGPRCRAGRTRSRSG